MAEFTLPFLEIGYVGASLSSSLLLLLILPRQPRFRNALALGASLLLSVLITANILFYEFCSLPITIDLFPVVFSLLDLGGTVNTLIHPRHFLIFLPDLLLLMVLPLKSVRGKLSRLDASVMGMQKKWLSAVLVIILLFTGVRYLGIYRTSLKLPWVHPFVKMLFLNPVNYYSVELGQMIWTRWTDRIDAGRLEVLREYYARRNQERSRGELDQWLLRRPERPNILIVHVESLKSIVIDRCVRDTEVTPALNRLVREGIYFPNFYSQAFSSCDAFFSVLTSLHPPGKKQSIYYRDNHFSALPGVLRQHGWTTLCIAGASRFMWFVDRWMRNAGFDQRIFREDFPDPQLIGFAVNDEQMCQKALDMLAKASRPWLGMIYTGSSHHPFDYPQIPRKFVDESIPEELRRYFDCVNYTDLQLATLLAGLEQRDLLDNTVIAIYGDHTIPFPSVLSDLKNQYPHITALGSSFSHLIDSNVPFILYGPGILKPGRVENHAAFTDIAPTLLDISGVSTPTMFLGHSLFQGDRGGLVITRHRIGLGNGLFFWGQKTGSRNFEHCIELESGSTIIPPENLAGLLEELDVSEKVLRYNLNFYPLNNIPTTP